MKIHLLIIFLLIFAFGCNVNISENKDIKNQKDITITELILDKSVYTSGQKIIITLNLNATKSIDDATIRFYGIFAKRYRLSEVKLMDISKGENTVVIEYIAPNCFGCSGIRPGVYEITADIITKNQTIAKESKELQLRV